MYFLCLHAGVHRGADGLCGVCRVGFVGVYAASMVTGRGPFKLLLEHISDPVHNTVIQNLQ